jgi:hypothetical protein
MMAKEVERVNRNAKEDPYGRKFRENSAVIRGADLRRRPGCEPVLRALALDRVQLGMRLHLARCRSCRRAAAALRENSEVNSARRAGLLLLAAIAVVCVIAAPFVISRLQGDRHLLPTHHARGGVALVVHAPASHAQSTG